MRVRGEELLANWFGWFNRTLEATAAHDSIPHGWFRYAYNGYILLQRVDAAVLEPHLPAAGFYNLMLTARKPGRSRAAAGSRPSRPAWMRSRPSASRAIRVARPPEVPAARSARQRLEREPEEREAGMRVVEDGWRPSPWTASSPAAATSDTTRRR